jgi:hypothetical protein
MIVKSGDTHPIEWKANLDLTGAEVRLVAKTRAGVPIPLACDVSDGPEGIVRHVLDGTLPIGAYRVELEASVGGEVITFPNDGYAQLLVRADLD